MKVGLSNPCIAFGAVVLFVNCWNSSCSFFQANLHHWNLPALLLTAPPFHCSHVKANACTYTHRYIYIYTVYMSSRQNPLHSHLSSCYCHGYRFWGGPIAFQSFVEINIRDPTWNQNPFLNRLGNGSSSCFVGFRCFGNTSCSFRVAFIWMHFPSCSFHLHASSFHCAFISFHCPFMFLS